MREQVCKYMCPYARFQSVMVDKDTFLVTYDKVRGEPRGSRHKSANQSSLGLGDCVDAVFVFRYVQQVLIFAMVCNTCVLVVGPALMLVIR